MEVEGQKDLPLGFSSVLGGWSSERYLGMRRAGSYPMPIPFMNIVIFQDFSLWFPRVEEDLDQILNLGSEPKPKPQTKPKPLVPVKPALPRKPTVPASVHPSETGPGPQKQQQIQAMDEMDILQYIQDHDTLAQTSPSLF